ncbi:ROK family protein [Glycomyces tenuis]|uniref:ROK family protein n=1 Tax=Glycomyces tenuis TaxID=58116 RepID=UPI00040C5AC2|nr:ROK family protein [Glycomyces tenuis]
MRSTGPPPPPVPSGSSHLLRTINERAALYHLMDNETLTRVELRRLTGLAKPTASHVMSRLLESGLAVTAGRTTARQAGPKAEVYTVNADYAFAAAATLREPDGITVAIADLKGHEKASSAMRVDFTAVPPDRAVLNLLRRTSEVAGIDPDRIATLHIAVPGAYDADTDTIGHADIPGLSELRMRTSLEAELGAAIEIHNDVNAATVAERRNPEAAGGLVVLWLGREGLGVGIDLQRGLLTGLHGAAGELGYVPVSPDRTGADDPTFQDWLGAPAVAELGRAHGIEGDDAPAVLAAAVGEGASDFLDEYATRVAAALRLLKCLLDPPQIVLAGEIARAGGETLLGHVRDRAEDFGERVIPSAVYGDAVAIGALDSAHDDLKDRILDSALGTGP